MADRIIIPGPGGNHSDADLSPLQVFAKEVEAATNKVCNANVPVPFVMGILHSVATEVAFNFHINRVQQQAELAARAMQEAAKLKPT